MKTCVLCRQDFPLDDFHFRNRKKRLRVNQCKACSTNRVMEHYHKTGGWPNARRRRRKHGMTYDEFIQKCEEQNWCCALCEGQYDKLVVDHDHNCCAGTYSRGQCVRGIICNHCNRGLGGFKDNPDFLRKAIEYLDA